MRSDAPRLTPFVRDRYIVLVGAIYGSRHLLRGAFGCPTTFSRAGIVLQIAVLVDAGYVYAQEASGPKVPKPIHAGGMNSLE